LFYEFSGQAFTLAGAFSYQLTLAADEWTSKKMTSLLLSKNLNLFYIVHVFEKD